MNKPRALVEHFFRHEFGRFCAALARSLCVRDLDQVEDLVQAALGQVKATGNFSHDAPARSTARPAAEPSRSEVELVWRGGKRRMIYPARTLPLFLVSLGENTERG